MEAARNYNQWLFSLVSPYLGKKVIEVGPGLGTMTQQILSLPGTEKYLGIEPNLDCFEVLMNRYGGTSGFMCLNTSIEAFNIDELKGENFDTVVSVNVLEHIQNDVEMVKAITRVLGPGGKIVFLIPAIPWAFGDIDKAVGHYRRYSVKMVHNLFKLANIKVEKVHFANFPGLLGWLYNTKVSIKHQQDDQQIGLFDKLVPFIRKVENIVLPPIGLSIVAVGRIQ